MIDDLGRSSFAFEHDAHHFSVRLRSIDAAERSVTPLRQEWNVTVDGKLVGVFAAAWRDNAAVVRETAIIVWERSVEGKEALLSKYECDDDGNPATIAFTTADGRLWTVRRLLGVGIGHGAPSKEHREGGFEFSSLGVPDRVCHYGQSQLSAATWTTASVNELTGALARSSATLL